VTPAFFWPRMLIGAGGGGGASQACWVRCAGTLVAADPFDPCKVSGRGTAFLREVGVGDVLRVQARVAFHAFEEEAKLGAQERVVAAICECSPQLLPTTEAGWAGGEMALGEMALGEKALGEKALGEKALGGRGELRAGGAMCPALRADSDTELQLATAFGLLLDGKQGFRVRRVGPGTVRVCGGY
jgi:hypothetical protein